MVGKSGRSRRACCASRRTSNGLCRRASSSVERRHPLAHRGDCGCAVEIRRSSSARSLASSSPAIASRPSPRPRARVDDLADLLLRERHPGAQLVVEHVRRRLGVEVDGRVQQRARGGDHQLGAAVAQAAEQVEAVLELVDPDVAAVDDPGEQPLVLEAALVGDQLDVLGPLALHLPRQVRSLAMQVEPDALDRQVAQHAVGIPDVVEVGLDAGSGCARGPWPAPRRRAAARRARARSGPRRSRARRAAPRSRPAPRGARSPRRRPRAAARAG